MFEKAALEKMSRDVLLSRHELTKSFVEYQFEQEKENDESDCEWFQSSVIFANRHKQIWLNQSTVQFEADRLQSRVMQYNDTPSFQR